MRPTSDAVLGIGKPALTVVVANSISYFGSGLTLPFILVYLSRARGISLGVVGIILATIGLAGLACTPLIGWLTDRWGARKSLVAAIITSAAGTASFALASNVASSFIAAAIFGAGMSSLWSAMNSLLAEVVPDGRYVRVFSLNSAATSIGIGLGAIIGGLFLGGTSPGPYQVMFVLDAASFAVFALLVVLSRHFPARSAKEADDPAAEPGWRQVLSDRRLLLVTALNALLVIALFSQLTAAFPAWTVGPAHSTARVVGIAIAVNSFLIAGLQPAIIGKLEQVRRTSAVAAGSLLFAGCWVVALMAPQLHGALPTAFALVGAMVLAACGDILVAPSLAALVNGIATDELRGRYNAFFNIAWQIGPILGPGFAGLMLGAGLASALLICLAVACSLAALAAFLLRQVFPAAVDAGTPSG